MRRVLGTLSLGACLVLGPVTAAHAQSPCDTYSGTCVKGTKVVKPPQQRPTVVRGVQLPFTGAEVTGLLAVGAGAVAGGTVLVAAGRRRRQVA